MPDPRCAVCEDRGWLIVPTDRPEKVRQYLEALGYRDRGSTVGRIVECQCQDVDGNLGRDRYQASRQAV